MKHLKLRGSIDAQTEEELPFNHEVRSIIYQRSKNVRDTIPFGTDRDIMKIGYTWVHHSLAPKDAAELSPRISVGGPDCKKPYDASRLNISAMSFGALSFHALMGLNSPSELKPGQLLGKNIPKSIKYDWDIAQAHQF